jgi:hypothetical protein
VPSPAPPRAPRLLGEDGGDAALAAHAEARDRFRLDPAGRAAEHTHFDEAEPGAAEWRVAQVLVDPEEANDWEAGFVLDLSATRASGRVELRLVAVGEIGASSKPDAAGGEREEHEPE